MESRSSANSIGDGQFSVAEALERLYAGRRLVLLMLLLPLTAGLVYITAVTPIYRIDARLGAVSDASLAGLDGGLGLNLEGEQIFHQTLQRLHTTDSIDWADQLARKELDSGQRTVRLNSPQETVESIRARLKIYLLDDRPEAVIHFEHNNPDYGVAFLRHILEVTNTELLRQLQMRRDALWEQTRNELRDRLDHATSLKDNLPSDGEGQAVAAQLDALIVELRVNLGSLEARSEFAVDKLPLVDVLREAGTPEKPIRPQSGKLLAICIMGGIFLGVIMALSRSSRESERTTTMGQ